MITIWFNSVYGPSERTEEEEKKKKKNKQAGKGYCVGKGRHLVRLSSSDMYHLVNLPLSPPLPLYAMRCDAAQKTSDPKIFQDLKHNKISFKVNLLLSLFRTWDASSPLPSLSFHAACSPNLPYTQRKGASIIILQEAVVVVDQIIKEHAFDVSSSSSLSSPSSTRPKTLAPYDRPPCFNVNKTPESSSLSDWLTDWMMVLCLNKNLPTERPSRRRFELEYFLFFTCQIVVAAALRPRFRASWRMAWMDWTRMMMAR